ncbi:MAG: cytochrome P450 [Bdellovibrionota bacterium]|nr:cytochrome P450 [Bdellovibrionota bacterium]
MILLPIKNKIVLTKESTLKIQIHPGPKGGLFGLKLLGEIKENPLKFYKALHQNFGETVSYKIGPVKIFQLINPDHLHEILVEKQKFFHKTKPVLRVLSKWNGNGLLLNSGDSWAKQRRLINPSFKKESVDSYISIVVNQVKSLFPDGETSLNMGTKLNELTFRIVAETLFGQKANEFAPRFIKEVEVLQELAMKEMMAPIPLPDWLPLPSKIKLRKAISFIHQTVDRFISECHLEGLKIKYLLTEMLLAEDGDEEEARGMSDKQARDESVNLLLGGNETMGTALTWLCYLLSKHPDIQDQIYNEIINTLGERDFQKEDLPHLKLLSMSFKEALRLYPPVYLLSREPLRPIEIGEETIKPGHQIHIPLFVLHRSKKWFEDPDQFKPERFSEENIKKIKPNTYLPFGLGPRACIGERFAHIEAMASMATLLKRFKLTGAEEPELVAKVSLYPKGGLPLKLIPRNKNERPD